MLRADQVVVDPSRVAYLIVALAFQPVSRRLPRSGTAISLLRVRHLDGRGILRRVLQVATTCPSCPACTRWPPRTSTRRSASG